MIARSCHKVFRLIVSCQTVMRHLSICLLKSFEFPGHLLSLALKYLSICKSNGVSEKMATQNPRRTSVRTSVGSTSIRTSVTLRPDVGLPYGRPYERQTDVRTDVRWTSVRTSKDRRSYGRPSDVHIDVRRTTAITA